MAHNVANNSHAYASPWNCLPSIHVSALCLMTSCTIPHSRRRQLAACYVEISASLLEEVDVAKHRITRALEVDTPAYMRYAIDTSLRKDPLSKTVLHLRAGSSRPVFRR